jgi:hypothetical protein
MISESRRLVTGFFTGRKTCRFRLMASCKKDGGEGAICSQKDILGPASCRKQYANVAKNLHLAVAKTKAITERVNTEFRAGAFNMFNHTEFARKRRRGMGSLPSSQGLLEEVGGLSWRKL